MVLYGTTPPPLMFGFLPKLAECLRITILVQGLRRVPDVKTKIKIKDSCGVCSYQRHTTQTSLWCMRMNFLQGEKEKQKDVVLP